MIVRDQGKNIGIILEQVKRDLNVKLSAKQEDAVNAALALSIWEHSRYATIKSKVGDYLLFDNIVIKERKTAEDEKVKNYLKGYGVEDYLDEEELDEDFLEDHELEEVQDEDEDSENETEDEESDGEDDNDDSFDSESGEDGNSEGGNGKDGAGKAKCKGNCRGNGTSQNKTSSNQSAGGGGSFQAGTTRKGKGKILGQGYVKALEKWTPSQIKQSNSVKRFDDHSFWKGEDENKLSKTIWENRVLQTCEAVKNIKRIFIDKKGNGCGNTPCFAERLLKAISERKLDWKTLLNDFIQEDVCDYSFSPPDRRFGDSDFFLPDFNEKEETVENLLFMIDTSGSMSDEAITEVYSEIKGAIELPISICNQG